MAGRKHPPTNRSRAAYVRLRTDEIHALRELAERESRTISSMIRVIVRERLHRDGDRIGDSR